MSDLERYLLRARIACVVAALLGALYLSVHHRASLKFALVIPLLAMEEGVGRMVQWLCGGVRISLA